MIDECMDGKNDMIITKSISRFARNTLDCLKFICQLKEKNIPVFFEKENIKGRSTSYHYGFPCTAGESEFIAECKVGITVSIPEWTNEHQSQSFSRIYKR